ncbi:MAG TPA: LON peptidase substrate-binding domain-containing protein [Oligoflexia bacterium]|nr:LON peptidase substrate-binding domain-containing protein [Oligoflexia bacterium]
MKDLQDIPLFPLNVALLPGELLPLHIFEPRYCRLLQYCHSSDGKGGSSRPFGISLVQDLRLSAIGCSAEVVSVLHQFNDGRSLILAVGERRYKLVELLPEAEFPQAKVEFVDEAKEEPNIALQKQTLDLYAELVRSDPAFPVVPPSVSSLLSFKIGACLGLDHAERIEMLLLMSENERLKKVLSFILARLALPDAGKDSTQVLQ